MYALHSIQAVMHAMHSTLRRLDLNLLLVFDALYRRRSVTLAADELAMSPSACSHALSRLRDALADELFVRTGSAMQPTAQAERMAGGVAQALHLLSDRLVGAEPFVPATSVQTFTFAATDYTAYALLPPLVARLERLAPWLHLRIIHAAHRESLNDLREGRVQFALSVSHGQSVLPEGIEALDCLADDYVVIARQGHPRIDEYLSLEQYLAERHIAVLPWNDATSVADAALTRQGLQRDVAVELPSLMAAPYLLARSDYLFMLPRRAAQQWVASVPFTVHDVPFEMPGYTLRALFHVRHAGQPGHQWIREQLLAALQSNDADLTG